MPPPGSAAARLSAHAPAQVAPALAEPPPIGAPPAATPPAGPAAPATPSGPAWLGWLRATLSGAAVPAGAAAAGPDTPLLVPAAAAAVAEALATLRAAGGPGAGLRALHWAAARNTLWLARLGLDVVAIEARPDWRACCAAQLAAAGLAGSVRLVGLSARHGPALPAAYAEATAAEPARSFDLVLADGPLRQFCLGAAAGALAPGGLLVLDDAEARTVAPLAARLAPFRIGRFGDGVWTSMLFRAPPGGLPALE